MPPVSLVVTDLDGTLWHTDDHVPDGVVAALAELAAREVPLLVATGRRATSARIPLERIGMAPPAVVLNGALGLDLATGQRFHRAAYSTDEAIAVLAAFQGVGLEPVSTSTTRPSTSSSPPGPRPTPTTSSSSAPPRPPTTSPGSSPRRASSGSA